MKTAAVISYCSYHKAFIERCVEEASKAADYVLVVAHDHFYDGVKDTDLDLEGIGVDFTVVEWVEGRPARYYHNELRKKGYELLPKEDFDGVFFIDADEILEGDKVKEWLENAAWEGDNYKLAHFWYYRDTCYRARQIEEGAVFVSKTALESPRFNWWGNREREDFVTNWNYKESYQGSVLGHHYSWAGTKEMLLRKVASWGHNRDTDWVTMVEEEFKKEFTGCPFRPEYIFTKVEPYVGFTFNEK